MGRKKQKRDRPEDRIFCWYCEKTFTDEHVLAKHQKEKHLKCSFCRKRLQSLNGLHIHCASVHKETISRVPNAIEGRDSFDYDVFGMEGIPDWYWQSLSGNETRAPPQTAAPHQAAPYSQYPTIVRSAGPYQQQYYPPAYPPARQPVQATTMYPGVSVLPARATAQPPPASYPPVGSYTQPHVHSAPLVSLPIQEPTATRGPQPVRPPVAETEQERPEPGTSLVEKVPDGVVPAPVASAGQAVVASTVPTTRPSPSSVLVFTSTDTSPEELRAKLASSNTSPQSADGDRMETG